MDQSRLILVTGATGYVGGRLVPELLDSGHRVRVLARHPERLLGHPWADRVEVIAGSATEMDDLHDALRGVDVAYYLLHSLQVGDGFEADEHAMARGFADVAGAEGLGRIVYLGGLLPDAPDSAFSPHMRSRAGVGKLLRRSGTPTVEFRAGMIIGSGSASFEMLRYVTERLPAMITPRWVRTRVQPIAIRDVLRYLVAAIDLPEGTNRHFDIGGPDILTYEQMMQAYAAVAGLRPRVIIPVPMLTTGLSAHWVGVVTPVPGSLAKPLIESLHHDAIRREHDIEEFIPDPPSGLVSFRRAVDLALTRIRDANVVTRWSGASVHGAPSDPLPTDPDWAGGSLYTDVRKADVDCSAGSLWRVLEGIGGERGWYSFPMGWEVRGLMDRAVGGVGLRRGRRDQDRLFIGDSLDFWRVEALEPPTLLRLRAEMRTPGLAWLEFTLDPLPSGDGPPGDMSSGAERTQLTQRAIFHPRGLAGHAYWWAISPFHALVFGSMKRNIAAAGVALEHGRDPGPAGRRVSGALRILDRVRRVKPNRG